MMRISETYILPVVGYRVWVLREGKLSSYAVKNFWTPMKANLAQCRTGLCMAPKIWRVLIPHESDEVPLAECGCGFYAFKTWPYLRNWLEEHRERHMVIGEVSLWGKLVDCQYG